ncbi:MAG: hypothetical protein ACRDT6_13395 [Micromonosporaceae bacterium]
MKVTVRVGIAALSAAALLGGFPLAASALTQPAPAAKSAALTSGAGLTSKTLQFTPGTDASAWYWVHQVDQETAGPRVGLPNPQRAETLPVAYEGGEPSKLSALKFDLESRGVPAGSKVMKFELTIVEATEPGEVPTANPNARVIEACTAASEWAEAAAELWEAKPQEGTDCAKGVRKEQPATEAEPLRVTWTFDLTKVAATWGVDPFANYGLVFRGVVPEDAGPTETWQVNLKLPQRDTPETPNDEAKETADRVKATMLFLPGAATTTPGAAVGGGGDVPVPGGAPGGGAPPAADVPSGAAPAGGDPPDLASGSPFSPTMPWYVWLLIPVGLFTGYLVRTALADGPATPQGTGVIDRIKRLNAARRGGPLPDSASPWRRLVSRGSGS